MNRNYTTEEFIKLAKEIHGDRYDYSKSIYTKWKEKLIIICPIHGEFNQTPSQHIGRKCGCPNCRWLKREETCLKKYNTKNPFSSKIIMNEEVIHKQKSSRKASIKEKYNVDNISQLEEIKEKKKQTSLKNCGKEYWTQTKEGKQYLSELNSSKEIINKIEQTNLKRHGVKCTFNTKKARANQRKALKSKEYSDKRKKISKQISKKSWETKKRNGTTNTSKFEKEFYKFLCTIFNENDILNNYKEKRYPFYCDFYIKSLDLFIELNIHWTHGKHWFNKNNSQDIKTLKLWQEKSILHPSYKTAIKVWTFSDLKKKSIAEKNNLNYIVLWNQNDIEDFKNNFIKIRKGNDNNENH